MPLGSGMPPGGTPPGMGPAVPGTGAPGPLSAMPGGMPGMAPPPPMGGTPPGASPGLASTIFQDLSPDMPPHYQLFDAADRLIKSAIATGGFYRKPAELAAAKHIQSQISRFVANYARANSSILTGSLEAPAEVPALSDTQADQEEQTGGD